jgi:hypothetical protein
MSELANFVKQNDTDFQQRNWEESVVRAEKVIVLYREVAKKALYCKMMEKRRPKFIFRFRKTILDVTWHVKNKCNKKAGFQTNIETLRKHVLKFRKRNPKSVPAEA